MWILIYISHGYETARSHIKILQNKDVYMHIITSTKHKCVFQLLSFPVAARIIQFCSISRGWASAPTAFVVIMSAMSSQITSLAIAYSGADQRKHQSSASLAFVHKWKMFPFDDVIMGEINIQLSGLAQMNIQLNVFAQIQVHHGHWRPQTPQLPPDIVVDVKMGW